MSKVDILILSNGPGELVTWVRPVVRSLRQLLGDRIRISVILSPCTHATGKEADIASSYPEVDRVQAASDFWRFLVLGKTAANWDWYSQGIVLFLGGDQFFTVVIAKRLGYQSVVYAEWDARWLRWIDCFGVMNQQVVDKVPQQYRHKLTVVGDLMASAAAEMTMANLNADRVEAKTQRQGDNQVTSSVSKKIIPQIASIESIENNNLGSEKTPEIIGLLPGSKAAKLAQGVPLVLAIAERIHAAKPQTKFVIPVAPTLDLSTLAHFADLESNPVIKLVDGVSAKLITSETSPPYLETENGLKVELFTDFPAYNLLSKCSLCLTTVGANTAELGSLGIPAIVLLPSNQLDAMRAWDGLPGLLVNLPFIGSPIAKLTNALFFKFTKGKLFAWPNIWAKREIVPELVGKLHPQPIADLVLDYLNSPEKLQKMREELQSIRGKSGAPQKLADLVISVINQT
ncbi:lipid-A-disaccharide synthase [Merismopedia glauca]|uniref:Lipid-A-disaccharide synthase n=1 Tax=Merismopedia glauca CCAP 1448/3 TaxID=1296344 RepID=A0A2T1C7N5_9CYAN|nr:lipid-A-disaccharide synthase [Merismopedia glauca]PSB04270.1 lipid-A-disaccharide synthase [Merismopedia glauca CCAP 1448/3]